MAQENTKLSRTRSVDFFEALEARRYLSNPVVHDVALDTSVAYPGEVIAITVHATATAGVRSVVFWLEDNGDALNQFVANSFDQPLGELFAPDNGTTDQYTLHVTVGASWKTNSKIGVDAQDNNLSYTQQPIQFVTFTNRPKPFIIDLRAETLPGGDIRLTAFSSTDGWNVTSTGIAGVTFFLDQNGNGQWDSGTDIDLGVVTSGTNGIYQRTVTPQGGWNTTWFAASAYDTRANPDRFGPNHVTVRRGDASPPTVLSVEVRPDDSQSNTQVISTGETIRIIANFAAPPGLRAVTLFFDRNQNGLWDAGIDTDLQVSYAEFTEVGGTREFHEIADARFGHGWQAFGIAVHDASGRGDDSWSSVASAWVNIENTPWLTNPVITPSSIPVGTSSIDMTFLVFDDDGVQGVRDSFIDVNGNGFRDGSESRGTNLTLLTPGRTNALWRLTFDTHNLSAGTYSINIWLQDYREVWGPRSIVTFVVA